MNLRRYTDCDDVPQWLRDGDYELEYHLDTVALLQMFSPYYSIAAISCASGINQHQPSHYANGMIFGGNIFFEVRGSRAWVHFAVRSKGNRRKILFDIK